MLIICVSVSVAVITKNTCSQCFGLRPTGWYNEAEASGGGGSKAGGLPYPSLFLPFPSPPLSIPPDPVMGKFPGFPPTNTTLTSKWTYISALAQHDEILYKDVSKRPEVPELRPKFERWT